MKHVIDLMYRICYLEKKSDPVGVVIHGKVCEPGSSIGINNNLITAFQGDENVCSSHRVFMVILIRISSSVIKKRSEQTSARLSIAWSKMKFNTLWFWSNTDATSSPFKRMDKSAFLLSCVATWKTNMYTPPSGHVNMPVSGSMPPPALAWQP